MRKLKPFKRPSKKDYASGVSIGSWLTIPHPSVAEILGRAGFDWLTVDLEHSATSLESVGEMIRVIDLLGLNIKFSLEKVLYASIFLAIFANLFSIYFIKDSAYFSFKLSSDIQINILDGVGKMMICHQGYELVLV